MIDDPQPYIPNNPVARAELLKEVQGRPEHAGITVSYPGDVRMKLARAGGFNLRWKEALLAEVEPYRMAMRAAGDDFSDEASFTILARTYARAVILELEGPGVPDDVHDVDAVTAWLLADEVLFGDIRTIAEDPENYPYAGLKEARIYGDPSSIRAED